MKVFSIVLMIEFTLSSCQLFLDQPQLVFNTYRKDINIVPLKRLKSAINYTDTDLLINITNIRTYIAEIDYSLRANILVWRNTEPENALFVAPIDKR